MLRIQEPDPDLDKFEKRIRIQIKRNLKPGSGSETLPAVNDPMRCKIFKYVPSVNDPMKNKISGNEPMRCKIFTYIPSGNDPTRSKKPTKLTREQTCDTSILKLYVFYAFSSLLNEPLYPSVGWLVGWLFVW